MIFIFVYSESRRPC